MVHLLHSEGALNSLFKKKEKEKDKKKERERERKRVKKYNSKKEEFSTLSHSTRTGLRILLACVRM